MAPSRRRYQKEPLSQFPVMLGNCERLGGCRKDRGGVTSLPHSLQQPWSVCCCLLALGWGVTINCLCSFWLSTCCSPIIARRTVFAFTPHNLRPFLLLPLPPLSSLSSSTSFFLPCSLDTSAFSLSASIYLFCLSPSVSALCVKYLLNS